MNRLFTNNEVSNHPLLVAKDKKYEVIVPEPESETPPPFFLGGGILQTYRFKPFPKGIS